MPTISIPIDNVDESALPQLEYALTFASEDIVNARISDSTIYADVKTDEACASATAKIQELVQRYSKTEFGLPTVAYAVSAEYSMIQAAAARGWIDERAVTLESLLAMRRAGADIVITYAAVKAARWLKEG